MSAPLGWKSGPFPMGRLGDGADRRQVRPQLDEGRDQHIELGPMALAALAAISTPSG